MLINNDTSTIYVVKGRSGLNFLVTTDFEKAENMQDRVDGAVMEYWINDKHVFTEEKRQE